MNSSFNVLQARLSELYKRVRTLENSPQSGLWRRQSAEVSTSQATTSSTFTDLATVGPSITVDVPSSGTILLTWGFWALFGSGDEGIMGLDFSGANTVAPATAFSPRAHGPLNGIQHRTRLITGLSAGSTDIVAKYQAVAGSPSFADRILIAVPL